MYCSGLCGVSMSTVGRETHIHAESCDLLALLRIGSVRTVLLLWLTLHSLGVFLSFPSPLVGIPGFFLAC